MPLLVQRRTRAEIAARHDEPALGLRLHHPGAWHQLELSPYGHDEPVWLKYAGVVKFRGPKLKFDGQGKWIVTRHRLLVVVHPGIGTAGLIRRTDEHILLALDLSDLSPDKRVKKRLGKWPLVQLSGANDPFLIELLVDDKRVPQLLEAIQPDVGVLDETYAAQVNERQRQKLETAEAARAQQEAEDRRRAEEKFDAAAGSKASGVLSAAARVLDHQRTWRFRVNAAPEVCFNAFRRAFSGGGVILRARWDIEMRDGDLAAVYQGRGGIMRVVTGMSTTASSEQEGAVGSEVRFTIESAADGQTVCAMWLASRGSTLGLTHDARFIKPYMRAVEAELRLVDPGVAVAKD
jgi:hypothetical protein